jgi:hypothetical protein
MGCRSKKAEEKESDSVANLGVCAPEDSGAINDSNSVCKETYGCDETSDEEEILEYVPEPEHDDQICRIEWRKGSKSGLQGGSIAQSSSLWGALRTIPEEEEDDDCSVPAILLSQAKTSSFKCHWDRLFSDAEEVDEEGIDHLFGLFESSTVPSTQINSEKENIAEESTPESVISLSMLSQGGQTMANEIQSKIYEDKKSLSALQLACPNWKENVSFAFFQKDKNNVLDALENVRKSRERMLETKRKILEAWERQHMALDVFEGALGASLDRLKSRDDDSGAMQAEAEGGFLTALSQDNDGESGDNDGMIHEPGSSDLIDTCLSPTKCRAEIDAVMEPSLKEAGLLLLLAGGKQHESVL